MIGLNMSVERKKRSMAYLAENALNAVCPYFTMFPLEYPAVKLKYHRVDETVVMDPFCGRGTTLFAARKKSMPAWGVDTSPVAVAIAKAKLSCCDHHEPVELAKKIIESVNPRHVPENDFFKIAYHRDTLRELCALREGLMSLECETDSAVVLRAAVLGCLHGPLSKDVTKAGYFSNQMPRTYASKPDYAVRFWTSRGMAPRKVSVLDVLQRKILRLSGLPNDSGSVISQVIEGDAQNEAIYPEKSKNFNVVITSPPYYGMRTYVQDQWLRNWFVGGPARIDYDAGPQLDHGGKLKFARSLARVWDNMAQTRACSLDMYVRFGVIPSTKVNPRALFVSSLEASRHRWDVVSVRSAKTASEGKRQAGQMKAKSNAAVEYDFHVKLA